jgi:hypothetical protein
LTLALWLDPPSSKPFRCGFWPRTSVLISIQFFISRVRIVQNVVFEEEKQAGSVKTEYSKGEHGTIATFATEPRRQSPTAAGA